MSTPSPTHNPALSPERFNPPGKANAGVIVVAHGSDGLNDNERGNWKAMIRGDATDLSQQGFVVLLPDYLAMTGTKPPTTQEDFAAHRDDWQKALEKVISDAASLPGIDASRIGLLGFSLGGHLMLRLRSMTKVLVSYFAPELDGLGPVNSHPLHALLLHGIKDGLVPIADATSIELTLKREKANVKLVSYDEAGHGFVGADPANTNASTKSKAATLKFFATHLK